MGGVGCSRGSPEFLAHWRWMEDLFTSRPEVPWNPGPAVSIQIGRQQQCLRYDKGPAWVETGCDAALPFVCEYLPGNLHLPPQTASILTSRGGKLTSTAGIQPESHRKERLEIYLWNVASLISCPLAEPQHFCSQENGSIWVPHSQSCMVSYKPHLPWTEAMTFCARFGSPLLPATLPNRPFSPAGKHRPDSSDAWPISAHPTSSASSVGDCRSSTSGSGSRLSLGGARTFRFASHVWPSKVSCRRWEEGKE